MNAFRVFVRELKVFRDLFRDDSLPVEARRLAYAYLSAVSALSIGIITRAIIIGAAPRLYFVVAGIIVFITVSLKR